MNRHPSNTLYLRKSAANDAAQQLLTTSTVCNSDRIVFQPIPFCGAETVSRAFEFSSCQLATDDADMLHLIVTRDPSERLYAAFARTFVAISLTDESHRDMTFADFARSIMNTGINPLDGSQFLGQSEYLEAVRSEIERANNEWLVPFERIPQLMTALEHLTGRRFANRKVSRSDRYQDFRSETSYKNAPAGSLFNGGKPPHFRNVATPALEQEIRDFFADDFELFRRSCLAQSTLPKKWNAAAQIYRRVRQVSSKTSDDRYPVIFQHAANEMHEPNSPARVLSFGCSTGEECRSLRAYFPNAQIHGCDIRTAVLRDAQDRTSDNSIRYFSSTQQELRANGPYDAIFAMSILCRWPETLHAIDCRPWYPFDEFVADIAALDAILNPGGVLVLYNTQFRFTDTEIARSYEPLQTPEHLDSGFVTKFDQHHQRLADQSYPVSVFRKKV